MVGWAGMVQHVAFGVLLAMSAVVWRWPPRRWGGRPAQAGAIASALAVALMGSWPTWSRWL